VSNNASLVVKVTDEGVFIQGDPKEAARILTEKAVEHFQKLNLPTIVTVVVNTQTKTPVGILVLVPIQMTYADMHKLAQKLQFAATI